VFFVCACTLIARLFVLTVSGRDSLLADMQRDSRRVYIVPAIRGRLLDKDGIPLAWSVRRFDLWWRRPSDLAAQSRDAAAFASAFPQTDAASAEEFPTHGAAPEESVCIIRGLTATQLEHARAFCGAHPHFHIKTTFERRTVQGCPDLQKKLGRVEAVDGREIGVSGEERAHNDLLTGRPGIYRVTVDKNGQWVPRTWQKLQDMQPGYDVYLPLRFAQRRR
jgi:cell division protein FtsI/penicillin-binding protein 2